MSSDKVIALTLEREGAIRGWRELAGPTNTFKGKAERLSCLFFYRVSITRI